MAGSLSGPENILVRQVGTKFSSWSKTWGMGKDYTLFAKIDGVVHFERKGKSRRKISVYCPQLVSILEWPFFAVPAELPLIFTEAGNPPPKGTRKLVHVGIRRLQLATTPRLPDGP